VAHNCSQTGGTELALCNFEKNVDPLNVFARVDPLMEDPLMNGPLIFFARVDPLTGSSFKKRSFV